MQNNGGLLKMPISKIVGVLVGFPIIATVISLLLRNRSLIIDLKLDFFYTFWIIIICWYLLQLFIVSKVLKSSGWQWSDIGFSLSKKKTIYFIIGYLVFAFGLLFFIESALANSTVNMEKFNAIPSLTPKTTTARIIFIFLGLAAGITEEIVYRGFAINGLKSNNINKWLAVLIASVPFIFQHGIKALNSIAGNMFWFWWYFGWGITFGVLFLLFRKLKINIILHWLIILSAMIAVLQAIE